MPAIEKNKFMTWSLLISKIIELKYFLFIGVLGFWGIALLKNYKEKVTYYNID